MKLHPFDGQRPWWRELGGMGLRVGVGTLLVLWLFQDAVTFPGWWLRTEGAAALDAVAAAGGVEVVHTVAEDGADVILWRHRARDADRAVLFWHGNGELVADHGALAAWYVAHGVDFVAVELRGYGQAGGWPREVALDRDARAAWAWATGPGGYDPARIVIHGRSVGGGPAARLASDRVPAGLVLEATFDSLAAVAADRLHLPGLRWAMRSPYLTIERPLPLPVFQVHGTSDDVVDLERARTLREVLPDVIAVEVEGGEHEQILIVEDAGASDALGAWLQRVVPAAR